MVVERLIESTAELGAVKACEVKEASLFRNGYKARVYRGLEVELECVGHRGD